MLKCIGYIDDINLTRREMARFFLLNCLCMPNTSKQNMGLGQKAFGCMQCFRKESLVIKVKVICDEAQAL